MFLDENDEVPYETLKYTAGECNYGGKVTDGTDRRTLMTIINLFYNPKILTEEYKFSPSGKYYAPPYSQERQGYIDYIGTLPLIASPEVYGLHENADISKDVKVRGRWSLAKCTPFSSAGFGIWITSSPGLCIRTVERCWYTKVAL